MSSKPLKKSSLIDKTVKSELEKRRLRLQEYLVTKADLTPSAEFEFDQLMKKIKEKPDDK